MKKLFCVLFSVLLTVSLCACGGDSGDVRGQITTDPTDPPFSLGTTANNTYKNTYLGLSCTLPSDWVFYTDEQIRELNNFVGDMAGEEYQELLKNATIIYDMYAATPDSLNSININLEKLNALQIVSLDLKTVLESQFPTIKSSLENIGYTNVQMQYEKITVDGKEYDGITVTANFSGISFYETCFCFLKGQYLANVTIACLQNNNIPSILNQFSFS